jgi:hypothetical protein
MMRGGLSAAAQLPIDFAAGPKALPRCARCALDNRLQ